MGVHGLPNLPLRAHLSSGAVSVQEDEEVIQQDATQKLVLPPNLFPRKGTANAQEEIAQAQEPFSIALLIAIVAAIAGGASSAGFRKLFDILHPTPQEEPKVDLSELISILGKDPAIQKDVAKTQTFGNRFRQRIPHVSKTGTDFLPYFVPKKQRSSEQAKIEGGLTIKQLQELMELCQEIAALFGLDPQMAKMALPLQG